MTIKHLPCAFNFFNGIRLHLKRLFVTTSCSLLLAMSYSISSYGLDNKELNATIKQLIQAYSQCLSEVNQTMPIDSAEAFAEANQQCAAPLQQIRELSPHAANQIIEQVKTHFAK